MAEDKPQKRKNAHITLGKAPGTNKNPEKTIGANTVTFLIH